jgi:hypothetical protein
MVEAEGIEAEGKESDRSLTDDLQRQKKPKETTRGYEAIARQEIRRARRLVTDGQPTPEATFAVSIAGVLALLDLASAIREQGSKGE